MMTHDECTALGLNIWQDAFIGRTFIGGPGSTVLLGTQLGGEQDAPSALAILTADQAEMVGMQLIATARSMREDQQ